MPSTATRPSAIHRSASRRRPDRPRHISFAQPACLYLEGSCLEEALGLIIFVWVIADFKVGNCPLTAARLQVLLPCMKTSLWPKYCCRSHRCRQPRRGFPIGAVLVDSEGKVLTSAGNRTGRIERSKPLMRRYRYSCRLRRRGEPRLPGCDLCNP